MIVINELSNDEKTEAMHSRYERARHFLRGAYSDQVVFNDAVYPTWIDGADSFWYIRAVEEDGGVRHEVRVVDAIKKSNDLIFENEKLAKALEQGTGKPVAANDLKYLMSYPGYNIINMEISLKKNIVYFDFSGQSWIYDFSTDVLKEGEERYVSDLMSTEKISPDGSKSVYIKAHDIWLKDICSGRERRLTQDGEEYNAYQVDFSLAKMFIGYWSPDSKKFLTIQHDVRKVGEIWKSKYDIDGDGYDTDPQRLKGLAMRGAEHVSSFCYVSIDLEKDEITKAQYPSLSNDYLLNFTKFSWWSRDSKIAYFVDAERYHKKVRVIAFDTQTGATRIILEETADTFFNFAHFGEDQPVMTPLPDTEELLWFSERSGWGHLYLYDLKTGQLKNRVTQGEWLVRNIVRYDAGHREIFLQTAGRNRKKDPYYRDLVRVNIDTGALTVLAESNHDIEGYSTQSTPTNEWGGFRQSGISPSGNFSVVTVSRVDTVPITYLLDRDGEKVFTIEEADVTRLPKDFQWPEPVKAVAADGKTDIYGVVYRPTDFTPDQSYPVISHVLNSPHSTFAAKSAFNVHQWTTFSSAAIAELGFIVVQFDGRGTPGRYKGFMDESYGDFERASDLSDHVSGIKQLSKRYSYMDLDRVGIVSEMFGNGASSGLLRYPEFYSVGVEGIVSNRQLTAALVVDRFIGERDSSSNLEQLASNLEGKLLLPLSSSTYGDFYGAAVVSMFRFAAALTRANRDFDISYDPDYAWGPTTYQIRRGWDYLVRHLLDEIPPENFLLNGTAMWDSGALKNLREDLGVSDF